MTDYPGNSRKDPQQEQAAPAADPNKRETRVSAVVTDGEVIARKRPWSKRFGDLFTGGDGQSLPSFLWYDIVQPMTRDMLYDVINGGAQRAIFGESRGRPTGRGGYGAPTAYNTRYNTPAAAPAPSMSQRGRKMHDFGELVIPNRHKAEEVRTVLYELLDRYQVARVSDFYDAVGFTPSPQDDRYGWHDLGGAQIRHVSTPTGGGYIINLPIPVEIPR